jgi:(p)ppGpp synthase/HD superfamily hydrolase
MAAMLQKAIELAVKAHRGSEDPPGEPYIVHPLRVMIRVSQADDARQDEDLRCTAVLHDTLERGKMTEKQLKAAGIPDRVVKAVRLLTHRAGATYADYVVRLKRDALARAVKIADLMDNADLRRVTFRAAKSKKDSRRVIRYAASYKYLTDQLSESSYRKAMRRGESEQKG